MTKEEMLAIVTKAKEEKRSLTDEEKNLLDAEFEQRAAASLLPPPFTERILFYLSKCF